MTRIEAEAAAFALSHADLLVPLRRFEFSLQRKQKMAPTAADEPSFDSHAISPPGNESLCLTPAAADESTFSPFNPPPTPSYIQSEIAQPPHPGVAIFQPSATPSHIQTEIDQPPNPGVAIFQPSATPSHIQTEIDQPPNPGVAIFQPSANPSHIQSEIAQPPSHGQSEIAYSDGVVFQQQLWLTTPDSPCHYGFLGGDPNGQSDLLQQLIDTIDLSPTFPGNEEPLSSTFTTEDSEISPPYPIQTPPFQETQSNLLMQSSSASDLGGVTSSTAALPVQGTLDLTDNGKCSNFVFYVTYGQELSFAQDIAQGSAFAQGQGVAQNNQSTLMLPVVDIPGSSFTKQQDLSKDQNEKFEALGLNKNQITLKEVRKKPKEQDEKTTEAPKSRKEDKQPGVELRKVTAGARIAKRDRTEKNVIVVTTARKRQHQWRQTKRPKKNEIEKKFFCEPCKKGYANYRGLWRHWDSYCKNSSNLSKIECGFCHRSFKQKVHAELHISKKHPDRANLESANE